ARLACLRSLLLASSAVAVAARTTSHRVEAPTFRLSALRSKRSTRRLPVSSMRTGARIGVDVGTVRIGVARSDLHGMLATPVETVARGDGDVARVLELASELDALEIVVGLPLALSG